MIIYLIDNQLVDFVSLDCHRIEHLEILEILDKVNMAEVEMGKMAQSKSLKVIFRQQKLPSFQPDLAAKFRS